MKVSVIIVNYKTSELVKNCIQSVLDKTAGIDYEVIVVDNHSGDDLRDVIASAFGSQVKLIMLDDNIGFGKANNEGVKMATGQYVLFLNPDTILINNAIKILSDTLDTNAGIGACGGNLYDEHMLPALSFRRLYPGVRWEIYELTAHKLENIIYRGNWKFNHTNELLKVAYISGADLMVRRKLIDTIGCFSPAFFMYNEDTDLCLSIHQAGYSIVSVPAARIQHLEGKSSTVCDRAFSEKGLFLSEQGRQRYYKKNIPPVRRHIANSIYGWSLHILYWISRLTKTHNPQAFQYRIKVFKQLYSNNCCSYDDTH